MNFYDLDTLIFIFIFPGFLFILLSLPLWMLTSNYLLKKIDKTQNLSFFINAKDLLKFLRSLKKENKFSANFSFLIGRIILLIALNYILISSIYNSLNNNMLIILLILFLSLMLNIIYSSQNLDIYKTLHEFIIIISLFIWIITLEEFTLTEIMKSPFSKEFLSAQLLLFLIILTSTGKINSYLDYNTKSTFFSDLNELNEYHHRITNENRFEKLLRWISESYNQILINLLLTLFLIPFFFNFVSTSSSWYYILVLLLFWSLFIILSLLMNLITQKIRNFEIGFEIHLKVVFLLFAIILYYLSFFN